jgi:hypothetical protein
LHRIWPAKKSEGGTYEIEKVVSSDLLLVKG